MQRGRWNTTVANAWGVLALEKFSAQFEAAPVTGHDGGDARAANVRARVESADDGTTPFAKRLAWPPARETLACARKAPASRG